MSLKILNKSITNLSFSLRKQWRWIKLCLCCRPSTVCLNCPLKTGPEGVLTQYDFSSVILHHCRWNAMQTHFGFGLRNADLTKTSNDGLACWMCFIWNAANSTSALSVSGNNRVTHHRLMSYTVYVCDTVCVSLMSVCLCSHQRCNVTEYFYSRTLLKCSFEVLYSVFPFCATLHFCSTTSQKEILYFLQHIFYLKTLVTSCTSNRLQRLHPKEIKWSHISPKILERGPKY